MESGIEMTDEQKAQAKLDASDTCNIEIDPQIAVKNLKNLADQIDCKWSVQKQLRRSIYTLQKLVDKQE